MKDCTVISMLNMGAESAEAEHPHPLTSKRLCTVPCKESTVLYRVATEELETFFNRQQERGRRVVGRVSATWRPNWQRGVGRSKIAYLINQSGVVSDGTLFT